MKYEFYLIFSAMSLEEAINQGNLGTRMTLELGLAISPNLAVEMLQNL